MKNLLDHVDKSELRQNSIRESPCHYKNRGKTSDYKTTFYFNRPLLISQCPKLILTPCKFYLEIFKFFLQSCFKYKYPLSLLYYGNFCSHSKSGDSLTLVYFSQHLVPELSNKDQHESNYSPWAGGKKKKEKKKEFLYSVSY